MKPFIALPLAALLAACVTGPLEPIADGMPVALGQTAHVGSLLASPRAVTEDSRCPYNARCIWAGRLIVTTRIDGSGWSETVPLTLGEAFATHGTTITLVSGLPEKRAERETPRSEYRLIFEGGH